MPFTERPFISQVSGVTLPLYYDFGMGWQGQSGIWTLYNLNWLAFNTSGVIIF